MRYIELTGLNNRQVCVSIDAIIACEETGSCTVVHLNIGGTIPVLESPREVLMLIEHARQLSATTAA